MNEGTSMEVAAQIVMRQPGRTMYQISDVKPVGIARLMSMAMGSGDADAMPAAAAAAGGAPEGAGGAAAGEMPEGAAMGEIPEGAEMPEGASGAGEMAAAEGEALAVAEGAEGSGTEAPVESGEDVETFDTIEALAEAYGFDAAVLQATIDRWNELVAGGKDEDFGSDFSLAQTIDTPPYKAVPTPPCGLTMMGGPQINANMQVVDEDYAPIPGLFAAGNCAGGFYGPNYPMQVQSGLARAFCTVSGYLAAKTALGVEA